MNNIIYDVTSNKPLCAGYIEENNSTVITFTGFQKKHNTSEIELIIDGIGNYTLTDNQLTVISDHTSKAGRFKSCLAERTPDSHYIRKSKHFDFVVMSSVLLSE